MKINWYLIWCLWKNTCDGCVPISVLSDATYCVENPCSGQSPNGTCPTRGAIATLDCFPHLSSYDNTTKQCRLHIDTECQPIFQTQMDIVIHGCVPKLNSAASCEGQGRSFQAECVVDSDCGNWNGNVLKCHDQDRICVCFEDDTNCLQGKAFDDRMVPQGDDCDSTHECQGSGMTCAAQPCTSCAEINVCIPYNNNTSLGKCMTPKECMSASFNCTGQIQLQDKIESDDQDVVKPPDDTRFGFEDDSLTLQIATSIIVLVLVVACVTVCVFRVKFRKDQALQTIEPNWSSIDTPSLTPPLEYQTSSVELTRVTCNN